VGSDAGWLQQVRAAMTGPVVLALAVGSIGMLVGSLLVTALVVARLPADYFRDPEPPQLWIDHHPVIRVVLILLKNLVGAALVALGIVLSLPGVPGQGVLTILLGLMLLDFPGRRRLERWLVARPAVTRGINRLRARFGAPPLEL
jgi:hypothetical protein